jgi:hypothetical protein
LRFIMHAGLWSVSECACVLVCLTFWNSEETGESNRQDKKGAVSSVSTPTFTHTLKVPQSC